MAISEELSLPGTWAEQKGVTETKQESEVEAVVDILKILNKKTAFISQKEANGGVSLLIWHMRDTVGRVIRHGCAE